MTDFNFVAMATNHDGTQRVTIRTDPYPDSPRAIWHDGESTLYAWHRRYDFADENAKDVFNLDNYDGFDDLISKEFTDNDVVLPVYMYEHSNIALSTSPFGCRWDSGQLGFIVCTEKNIINRYGSVTPDTKEMARKDLEREISEYSDYAAGMVYTATLDVLEGTEETCPTCGHTTKPYWEEEEYIGSIYGDWEKHVYVEWPWTQEADWKYEE